MDTHVFPSQRGLAVLTVDVCYSVKPSEQHPLLSWPTAHIHPGEKDREKERKRKEGEQERRTKRNKMG